MNAELTPQQALLRRTVREALVSAFPEIDALSEHCRFCDCMHRDEPGCAVLAAVADGELPERRLESYQRLVAEMEGLARRRDERAWRDKDQTGQTIAYDAERPIGAASLIKVPLAVAVFEQERQGRIRLAGTADDFMASQDPVVREFLDRDFQLLEAEH